MEIPKQRKKRARGASATPSAPAHKVGKLVIMNSTKDMRKQDAHLIYSAREGRVGDVRELLKMGADMRSQSSDGRTAIHFAAGYGRTNMLKVLVELGADLRACDESGQTALHVAAGDGNIQAVQMLLKLGANVHAYSADGIAAYDDMNTSDENVLEVLEAAKKITPIQEVGGNDAKLLGAAS
eukprot:CAMPEP_0114245230 /NCGR_PEP_ID=MMETSP0058-20121206/11773_1 /TAXON_ID=36894 /ORGANISM="Pyramimonas parkeae, CCMP726" /LENGTH=181 /DNA_ID=CAMNT_0001358245 /DNA_START=107 /DNA_END=649 /DNA_ORIENTATION=+